ncbi:MAG: hypothetical protein HY516_04325 [Candidatus Aenigmarchaeota archaeon]|nr:hypothetical protein [Candidatus Aenigmarchaeota archaeon]
MTLPDGIKQEIRNQFDAGYHWFRQRTGYDVTSPANVYLFPTNPDNSATVKTNTGMQVTTNAGKPSVDVFFSTENTQTCLDTKEFAAEGAQAAFTVYRTGVRGLGAYKNPLTFVLNLAYRELNGKMRAVLPVADGEDIYTTMDLMRRCLPFGVSPTMTRRIVQEMMKRLEPQRPPHVIDKVVEMAMNDPDTVNILGNAFRDPRVAVAMLDSVQNTDVYRTLSPYLEANDLVEDLTKGREDPAYVAPFLRFLSDELYDGQKNIGALFMEFKTSRA